MAKEYPIVDSVESFETALARVRAAQKVYATYTQDTSTTPTRTRRPSACWSATKHSA